MTIREDSVSSTTQRILAHDVRGILAALEAGQACVVPHPASGDVEVVPEAVHGKLWAALFIYQSGHTVRLENPDATGIAIELE
jgi:hypothetical protein